MTIKISPELERIIRRGDLNRKLLSDPNDDYEAQKRSGGAPADPGAEPSSNGKASGEVWRDGSHRPRPEFYEDPSPHSNKETVQRPRENTKKPERAAEAANSWNDPDLSILDDRRW
jgi:hypothetical protein